MKRTVTLALTLFTLLAFFSTGNAQRNLRNCWGTYGEDDGTDVYEISLQNGWTSQSRTVKIHKSGNDTWDYVHGPTPDFSISPHWNPAFEWSVTSNDEVRYKVWITIAGPKGVPYK